MFYPFNIGMLIAERLYNKEVMCLPDFAQSLVDLASVAGEVPLAVPVVV